MLGRSSASFVAQGGAEGFGFRLEKGRPFFLRFELPDEGFVKFFNPQPNGFSWGTTDYSATQRTLACLEEELPLPLRYCKCACFCPGLCRQPVFKQLGA